MPKTETTEMTAEQHYAAAVDLLAEVGLLQRTEGLHGRWDQPTWRPDAIAQYIAAAHVHALLAGVRT